MAASVASQQSTAISLLRNQIRTLLDTRKEINSLRERFQIEVWPTNFDPAAFGGDNGDLDAAKVTNGLTALASLESVFVSGGNPTFYLEALEKFH